MFFKLRWHVPFQNLIKYAPGSLTPDARCISYSSVLFQKEKSKSLTFFGLAKSILRERKKSARKEEIIREEETEKQIEGSESVDAKPKCVNYSPNLETLERVETSERELDIR